jgi:hypothetical protein
MSGQYCSLLSSLAGVARAHHGFEDWRIGINSFPDIKTTMKHYTALTLADSTAALEKLSIGSTQSRLKIVLTRG